MNSSAENKKYFLSFLTGVATTIVAALVVYTNTENELKRGFIPVYEECKDRFIAFYEGRKPYVEYEYFEFPQYVENARLVGIIELKSEVVSDEYLNSVPSDKDAPCMPNAYSTGNISDSFDTLFIDIVRAKERGSEDVYVDIHGDSYMVRFRR